MGNNIIEITTEDLHFGCDDLNNGIYERVSKRIKDRNDLLGSMGLPPIGSVQERNMLVGEVGEVVARKDLLSRGFKIIDDSWSQFTKSNGYETVVDLAAHDGNKTTNYQVKSSECGNRSIKLDALSKCINSPLHFMVFVAIRQINKENGKIVFEGKITSQMMPRHIPQLATWKRTPSGFCHVDNLEFIKDWQRETEIKNNRTNELINEFTSTKQS